MHLTTDLALLLLRVSVGGLIAGHGAQKLFGAYGGTGVEGTTRRMRSLGLAPARPMALAAGASDLGGGVLTATGLLGPLGPLAGIGAMTVASTTAHAGRPVWAQKGGAELPITNMAVLGALLLAGPGHFALDRLLGIRVPRLLAVPGLAGIGLLAAAIMSDRSSVQGGDRIAVPVNAGTENGRVPWTAEATLDMGRDSLATAADAAPLEAPADV
jgi:putative oxidoreductase